MYDHTLHRGRKHSCCFCLHAFVTEEILKRHIKDCFRINGKQTIKMPKKGEHVKFKDFERKIKSPFMIYADFESILVLKIMESKIQMSLILTNIKKNIACSYGYKLVCVDDKSSKAFNSS